jgi:uncharacterized RDD family membrane protein YckC
MNCSKCGRETENAGKFCQWCGADLKGVTPKLLLRKKVAGMNTENFSGLGRRFLAFIVDFIFILIIDLVLTGIFGLNEGIRMVYQYYRHQPMTDRFGQVVYSLIPQQVIIAFLVLVILVPWLYFAYLESSKNQATLGKMALRSAVTDLHGNRITFSRASLRFFAKILSLIVFFVGFIIIAFTRYKQGLHDMIAGTFVFEQ